MVNDAPAATKLRPWHWMLILSSVPLTAFTGVATVQAQAQVAIARTFLDEVRRGDLTAAEGGASGAALDDLRALRVSPTGSTGLAQVRASAAVHVSWNTSIGWSVRCIEATATDRHGRDQDLFVEMQELDGLGWRVVHVLTEPPSDGPCEPND